MHKIKVYSQVKLTLIFNAQNTSENIKLCILILIMRLKV